MNADTYLKQGRLLDQRIKYHIRKLAELREDAYDISAPALTADKVQTSPNGDAPFIEALTRMEEMRERIKHELEILVALREQIDKVIHRIEREEYQLALSYKYLENMTWQQIGDTLHVDKTTARRWALKGLELVVVPDDPIIVSRT